MERYKVINIYPNSPFIVGHIIDFDEDDYKRVQRKYESLNIEYIKLYDFPHIFQKLYWWEDIKFDELPRYVKSNKSNAWLLPSNMYFEVENYTTRHYENIRTNLFISLKGFLDREYRITEFQPATKEEYEIQNKNYKTTL